MAKKYEVKKISPAKCIESLREYNQAVFLLVTAIDSILTHIEDGRIKQIINDRLNSVKEFYES